MGVHISTSYVKTGPRTALVQFRPNGIASTQPDTQSRQAAVRAHTHAYAETMSAMCGLLCVTSLFFMASEPRTPASPTANALARRTAPEGDTSGFTRAQRQREAVQIVGLIALLLAIRVDGPFGGVTAQNTQPDPASRPRTRPAIEPQARARAARPPAPSSVGRLPATAPTPPIGAEKRPAGDEEVTAETGAAAGERAREGQETRRLPEETPVEMAHPLDAYRQMLNDPAPAAASRDEASDTAPLARRADDTESLAAQPHLDVIDDPQMFANYAKAMESSPVVEFTHDAQRFADYANAIAQEPDNGSPDDALPASDTRA